MEVQRDLVDVYWLRMGQIRDQKLKISMPNHIAKPLWWVAIVPWEAEKVVDGWSLDVHGLLIWI